MLLVRMQLYNRLDLTQDLFSNNLNMFMNCLMYQR